MLEQMQREITDFLTPAAAQLLADYFRAIAFDFEHVAKTLAHREKATVLRRRRKERLRRIYMEAEALRDDGRDLEAAFAELSFAHGEPIAAIRAWYELGAKLAGKMKRARRNREVARLARQGLTNAEIGAKLNPPLHPKHIARILRTTLAEPEPVIRSKELPVSQARKARPLADEPAPAPTPSPLDASAHRPPRDVKVPRAARSILQLPDGLQSTHLLAQRLVDLAPA